MRPDREDSRLNEVDIRLCFGPRPEDPPYVVYAITVAAATPRRSQAGAEDRYLHALEPVTHAQTGEARHPYSVQVRNSRLSPRGKVAGVSILMHIAGPASGGVLSATTLAAARTAFETIGGWSTGPRQTLDRGQALAMALRRISSAYPTLSAEDLDLVRQDELPGGTGWALDIAAPGLTVFRVQITASNGVPCTTRISRHHHDPSQLVEPATYTDGEPRLAVSVTGESTYA